MKIALVSPYDFPYPGGITEHIIALANGAQQRGHEVQILAACSGYQGQIFSNTRVVTNKITAVPIGGSVARVGLSPFSYSRIKKILQREAFDVIHLHEPFTPSIAWFVLMQTYTMPQTVTIGTFHAYHERPNWFYVRGRPIFSKFFARLDNLIAVSRAAHNFVYQMFPGDYRIIPNGVDLNRFGKEIESMSGAGPPGPNKKLTILFVGRLDKRKGFLNLLQAFIKIKPNYPHLQLKVVGPFKSGACQPYQDIARAHHVTDIEFVGYISPEKLPGVYHTADIFCAPSIGFESFGIILLEAMAAGLPIVASDILGYRSVITAGQEGLLAPPGQPMGLANALCQLLDNPHLRQAMGRRGRLKANQYNWDHIVDKILEVYLDTIERKKRTRPKFLHPAEPGIHIRPGQAKPEGKSC